jgi:hypothetical protein
LAPEIGGEEAIIEPITEWIVIGKDVDIALNYLLSSASLDGGLVRDRGHL